MAEEKPRARILDENVIRTEPTPGEIKETILLTYRYPGLRPRTVPIPKDKDTPEYRSKVISADVKKAQEFKPTEIELE